MQQFRRLLPVLGLAALFWPARAEETERDTVTVMAVGRATLKADPAGSEEEAVWDAKRNAVEQAAGLLIRSRTVGRDYRLESDEIRGEANGFIRRWELVPDSRHIETVGNGRVLQIAVRATVALLPMIRRLSDIADVYQDLERPRLRLEIDGDPLAADVQHGLIASLRKQGFEIVEDGPAEVRLIGRLELTPTLRLGTPDTPYGLGEVVGSCRARLRGRLVSTASEEALFTVDTEAAGSSFSSDEEARQRAAAQVADRLLNQEHGLFVPQLLARWTQERQDGFVVALQVTGLDPRRIDLLREQIHDLRGYQGTVSEQTDGDRWTVRFRTRTQLASLRRRLGELSLAGVSLAVGSKRGPTLTCTARR